LAVNLAPPPSVKDQHVRRAVTQANALALAVVPLVASFQAAYLQSGNGALGLWLVPAQIAAVAGLLLNCRGYVRLGRHLMHAVASFSLFCFALHLGPSSGNVSLLYLAIVASVFVFDIDERADLALGVLQPMAYVVLIRFPLWQPHFLPPAGPETTLLHGRVNLFASTFLILFGLIAFAAKRRQRDRVTEDAQKRLQRQVAYSTLLKDIALIVGGKARLAEAASLAVDRIAALAGWEGLGFAPRGGGRTPAAEVAEATLRPVLLTGTVALPVSVEGETVGVLEFARRPDALSEVDQDADFLEVLKGVADQLGAVATRQAAQERADEREERLVAAARMASLGEMAGGIAHEINNPLSVIQAYMARIRRFLDQPDGRARILGTLDAVQETILRINRIVTGLNGYARGEEAREAVRPQLARQIVESTVTLAADRFRKQGVAFEVDLPPETLAFECRPTQIEQVLINLLNNAIDAVEGAPRRIVRLCSEDRGDRLVFEVTDSGPGVPPKVVGRLMQPFFTTKPPGRGTGLGLSISKGIVESHGGRLSYERRDAETRFTVELPKRQSGTLPASSKAHGLELH
jgi:C4-dicarboxylate-specific signal transduction histidine kinase